MLQLFLQKLRMILLGAKRLQVNDIGSNSYINRDFVFLHLDKIYKLIYKKNMSTNTVVGTVIMTMLGTALLGYESSLITINCPANLQMQYVLVIEAFILGFLGIRLVIKERHS